MTDLWVAACSTVPRSRPRRRLPDRLVERVAKYAGQGGFCSPRATRHCWLRRTRAGRDSVGA
ncbi:MAG: hypothetical protein U0841_14530 [Chloroflexia bacterium]